MARTLPLLPRSFRARLVLAFAGIVAIALALVLAALPRLLDAYFLEQETASLDRRTEVMASLVAQQILAAQSQGTDAIRPILQPTKPLTASRAILKALGDERAGFVKNLTDRVAQADVAIRIASSPKTPDDIRYELIVQAAPPESPGQQRENIVRERSFTVFDRFWSQSGAAAPGRRVTVRLSNPYSFRVQTLETIVGVMAFTGALALGVALVASILLANLLTTPVRRLTEAARALGQGNLDARVPASRGAAPEVAELATAFNAMAERLQESMTLIRRDRDRSRDFLADVSHELRTPIAALRTFTELLQEGAAKDPATREEFLQASRQQIERLDWLATNLLELSKLESGLVALDLRPDDLRVVVEDAVEQAEPNARRKGIELAADVPEEPVRLAHDPPRMGQVLGNLIGNAIKFTEAGGRVAVHLRETPEGAELSVRDTGVGIDAAELPRVFDRFFRGSQAHEERAGGSGLGLSIVRSIVEMHGGRVTIQSKLGSGTEVVVTLPRDVSVSSPRLDGALNATVPDSATMPAPAGALQPTADTHATIQGASTR